MLKNKELRNVLVLFQLSIKRCAKFKIQDSRFKRYLFWISNEGEFGCVGFQIIAEVNDGVSANKLKYRNMKAEGLVDQV